MRFFRNVELIDRYNVSDKAVRNWILSSVQSKNDLELYRHRGKLYIADTIQNIQIIERLVEHGRKYRNHRSSRSIKPKKEFYDTFSTEQILEIANQLDINHDLPGHYKYFGEGAEYWDQYLHKLNSAGSNNLLTNTIETIDLNWPSIDAILDKFKYVNLINVCVGNSLAARSLLNHIQQKHNLSRIVLIDLSPDMLRISKQNIENWLQKDIVVETYRRDISHERFIDVANNNPHDFNADNTINLVLFLAGPIVNFKQPDQALYTIADSINKNDLLITTLKRDTEQTRNFFDFAIKQEGPLISRHDSYLLDLLNIDTTYYDLEQSFDPIEKVRSLRIRLRVDLNITFELNHYSKTVELKRGMAVYVWRSWHHSDQDIIDRFNRTGFETITATRSRDHQLNLLLTQVKSK